MSVPFTRTLPYVLRDQLNRRWAALRAGKVAAVPDATHVTVDIGGSQLTIPRLSSYTPTVAEGVQILADENVGLLLALGAVGGVTAGQGPPGPPGPQGPPGGSATLLEYQFSTGTSPPPPNTHVQVNNATPASVTRVYADYHDVNAVDVSLGLRLAAVGWQVYIQDKTDSTNHVVFDVTADAIDHPGAYVEIPVAFHSGTGSGLQNNARVLLGLVGVGKQGPPGPTGPKGDTGATGPQGPPGTATVPARLAPTQDQNNVTDANNATQAGWWGTSAGCANLPAPSGLNGYGTMIVSTYNGAWITQIWQPIDSDLLWMRTLRNSAWGAWIPYRYMPQHPTYADLKGA